MKRIFRAIIKILFVVVIPVIVSALVIKFFLITRVIDGWVIL